MSEHFWCRPPGITQRRRAKLACSSSAYMCTSRWNTAVFCTNKLLLLMRPVMDCDCCFGQANTDVNTSQPSRKLLFRFYLSSTVNSVRSRSETYGGRATRLVVLSLWCWWVNFSAGWMKSSDTWPGYTSEWFLSGRKRWRKRRLLSKTDCEIICRIRRGCI